MSDGELEEFQAIGFESEEFIRDLVQHVCRSRTVKKIGTVIQAARVVEEGEEADDGFVSSGFRCIQWSNLIIQHQYLTKMTIVFIT